MEKKYKKQVSQGVNQCCFQIIGRRCNNQIEMCSDTHQLNSKYCEYHLREEYLHECEYITDFNLN